MARKRSLKDAASDQLFTKSRTVRTASVPTEKKAAIGRSVRKAPAPRIAKEIATSLLPPPKTAAPIEGMRIFPITSSSCDKCCCDSLSSGGHMCMG